MIRLVVLFFLSIASLCFGLDDPLPSWNEGEAKHAILQFVETSTNPNSKNFIPKEERIATFDQDGTLWVEKPIYPQFLFAIDRIKSLAPEHPEWKKEEPYRTILEGNLDRIENFTTQEIEKILALTHAGMTVEEYQEQVRTWIEEAKQPRFHRLYTQLIYQPMLEVIQLLRDHDFDVYIVSGGGQEFIRVYADRVYGIPSENIVGTTGKVEYNYKDGQPVLVKLAEVLFVDDKKGKPEGINLFIGKHPVAAFGNSDGDREMLEWSQAKEGKTLQMLVHHDDPVREYAYGPESKVGTFSESLMEEAENRDWIVISMKEDWKVIFPGTAYVHRGDSIVLLR